MRGNRVIGAFFECPSRKCYSVKIEDSSQMYNSKLQAKSQLSKDINSLFIIVISD